VPSTFATVHEWLHLVRVQRAARRNFVRKLHVKGCSICCNTHAQQMFVNQHAAQSSCA